jgi:hypothetical protein
MGTRSLTRVYEGATQLVCLYRQMDGYPKGGHGQELSELLHGMAIVNGIGSDTPPKAANGAGCLAAKIVAHFKDDIGGFYLVNPAEDDHGQDYEYKVHVTNAGFGVKGGGKIRVEVISTIEDGKVLFDGTPKAFLSFCAKS